MRVRMPVLEIAARHIETLDSTGCATATTSLRGTTCYIIMYGGMYIQCFSCRAVREQSILFFSILGAAIIHNVGRRTIKGD
jgi:hypothetical protein